MVQRAAPQVISADNGKFADGQLSFYKADNTLIAQFNNLHVLGWKEVVEWRTRGLLCTCNLLLGTAKDDLNRLAAAARYLCHPPIEKISHELEGHAIHRAHLHSLEAEGGE